MAVYQCSGIFLFNGKILLNMGSFEKTFFISQLCEHSPRVRSSLDAYTALRFKRKEAQRGKLAELNMQKLHRCEYMWS